MRTYPLAIFGFSMTPVDLWTLRSVANSLENGGLPRIRSSNNEDPELDRAGDSREIGNLREIREIESRKVGESREIGDLREIGAIRHWREILMWILSTKAFVRKKSGYGVELGRHLWGLSR
jgi:hypothetical protein